MDLNELLLPQTTTVKALNKNTKPAHAAVESFGTKHFSPDVDDEGALTV